MKKKSTGLIDLWATMLVATSIVSLIALPYVGERGAIAFVAMETLFAVCFFKEMIAPKDGD